MDSFIWRYAHHERDTRTADIRVHDADCGGWVGGEGVGEHGCEGGFADTAFAAEDEDFVVDGREAGGYEGEVGVGAGGGGGADGLVGTAGAGGGGACKGGFRARTVFGFGGDEGRVVFERGGEVDLDGRGGFDGGGGGGGGRWHGCGFAGVVCSLFGGGKDEGPMMFLDE